MTPMVSATIDTVALKHNLQRIRDFAPRSRVMAVIKANAYGHGLVAVARALDEADAFAVARVDEGLTLRMAGIQKRTLLLEGVFDRGQLDSAAAAGFELVVHTPEQIELLRQAGAVLIWLHCPVDDLLKRIAHIPDRPLFRDAASFRKLYEERLPFYELAEYRVESNVEPLRVVEQILALGIFPKVVA